MNDIKTFFLVGILSIMTSFAMSQTIQTSKDKADVERIIKQNEDTYNKGDAAAYASLFATDAVMRVNAKLIVQGQEEIRNFYTQVFENGGKNLKLGVDTSRSLPNILLITGSYTFSYQGRDGLAGGFSGFFVRKGDGFIAQQLMFVDEGENHR